MIKFNGKQHMPSSKLSTIIKHRCKINSYYYYIQIYVDAFVNSEKITFLIKSKKDQERNSLLYKRTFNYADITNYNKYFKYFSSLEDIFITIAQSIEENKYMINNNLKCISLIIRVYISKIKKYVNICINLNEHKNLHPLSMNKGKENELKKIMLGIQNEEELSYAILDIRERLKNLEMNQTIINNNINNDNNNLINVYRNNDLSYVRNYYQQHLSNSMLIDNIKNNNAFDNSINKKNIKAKKSAKTNMNNFINNNKDELNTNLIKISPNKTNTNYFNNNTNNISSKNVKTNTQKIKISGVNELIKKINDLETSKISKENNNITSYKLNSIDSNINKINYFPNLQRNNNQKKEYFNKSVDTQKKNNDSDYFNSNISQISQTKKNHIKILFNNFNKEKNMNGSKFVENENNNDEIKMNKIKNKSIEKSDIKEKNNAKKFINKNSTIEYNENDNLFSSAIKSNSNIFINNEEPIIKNENNYDKYITKKKTEKEIEKNVKIKKKKSEKKNQKNKDDNNLDINNNDSNINNIKKENNDIIDQENGYSNNNINNNNNFNTNNNIINSVNIENSSEKENPKVKKLIQNNNLNKIQDPKNVNKKQNSKMKKFSSAIKDKNSIKNKNSNINDYNSNISINSTSSKPIIKHNVNRSISSSMSNVKIRPPKNVPIFPPEKLGQYINSNIIFRKVELNLLKNKLSNNNKKINVSFDLLYRATRDGDSDTKIKKLTLGYDDVITLFYTNEGARFGIYIKRKKNHYIKAKDRGEKPGTSFIFGLNNLVIYDIYKNKYGKGDYNKVLCFGCLDDICTNGTKWMIYTPQNNFLQKKCKMGSGEDLFNEIDIEQIVGPNEYTIKEVEIFSIEFENDDDNESDS